MSTTIKALSFALQDNHMPIYKTATAFGMYCYALCAIGSSESLIGDLALMVIGGIGAWHTIHVLRKKLPKFTKRDANGLSLKKFVNEPSLNRCLKSIELQKQQIDKIKNPAGQQKTLKLLMAAEAVVLKVKANLKKIGKENWTIKDDVKALNALRKVRFYIKFPKNGGSK